MSPMLDWSTSKVYANLNTCYLRTARLLTRGLYICEGGLDSNS